MRQQTQGLDKQDILINSLAKETGSLGGQGEGELEGTYSGRSQSQGEDGQDREARQQATQFSSVAQSCPTLCDPMDYSPPGSFVHGDSPGKNTGVGCHTLLQGIFPTQETESRSPALQADSLPTNLPGKHNIPTLCQ